MKGLEVFAPMAARTQVSSGEGNVFLPRMSLCLSSERDNRGESSLLMI